MKTHVFKGLILKDWYSVRPYLMRQMGLLGALYLVISFFLKTSSMLAPMLILGAMMGELSLFSLDDSCQWYGFAVQLNLRPRQLAGARYALVFGSMLGVTVVASLLSAGLELLAFGPLSGSEEAGATALASIAAAVGVFVCYGVVMLIEIPVF